MRRNFEILTEIDNKLDAVWTELQEYRAAGSLALEHDCYKRIVELIETKVEALGLPKVNA